jgi:predicted Fe-S protein YdhL (DUF1289 family)
MNPAAYTVTSPCVRQCCLNEADICLGCFRSLEEIKQWTLVDDNTRQHFLVNAKRRRELTGKQDN